MNEQRTKWKTEEIAQTFVEGVRGAIPAAKLQLELIGEIVRAWCPRPSRILDLGCGDGILGRMLLEFYPSSEAIFGDFSEPMLDRLRDRLGGRPRATVINLDFSTPSWAEGIGPEQPFDLIVSGFAVHHQPDQRKKELYAEVFGLLREGGLFLNLDQVSSATPEINSFFDWFFLENIRRFHAGAGLDVGMNEIEKAFFQDKKENMPAPVDLQCRWLRDIGFKDVDCFFRLLELALFGGRKPAGAAGN